MVGTLEIAQELETALTTPEAEQYLYAEMFSSLDIPDGFSLLGNGCSRVAFLHEPTETVYKFDYDGGGDNTQEAAAAEILREALRNVPEVVIPEITKHTEHVVAATYYTEPVPSTMNFWDDPMEMGDENWQFLSDLINDIHRNNLRMHDGRLVFIDLGMASLGVGEHEHTSAYRGMVGGVEQALFVVYDDDFDGTLYWDPRGGAGRL